MLGQSMKLPSVGRLAQDQEPPAQFDRADSIKETPIKLTVGPVTKGGKSFLRALGVMKDSPISRRAQSEAVPRIAP